MKKRKILDLNQCKYYLSLSLANWHITVSVNLPDLELHEGTAPSSLDYKSSTSLFMLMEHNETLA